MLMSNRARGTAIAILLLLAAFSPSARADDSPVTCYWDMMLKKEVCVVTAGGSQTTPPGSQAGPKSPHTPACSIQSVYPPSSISCTNSQGWTWDQSRQCYIGPLTTAPPSPTGPNGETGGQWYGCYGRVGPPYPVYLQTPPQPPVDPEALAREVVSRMALHGVTIGIVPRSGSRGVLGMPVYLWVDNPGPETVGPITRSATSFGVTVTATAHVQKFVWDMGDGTAVTCTDPGTPYQDSFGARPSPTCGYTYPASGSYKVGATSYWRVDWTGNGDSGWFEFSFTSTTAISIGEVQALTDTR